jgi:hypothetical protein
MHKKILAAVVALVAFAAVPAIATASPILTENGTVVSGKILATQSGSIVLTTSFGNVTCTKSTLTGTVLKNGPAGTGTHIEGTLEKATFTNETGGACSSTFPFNPSFTVDPENLHWCITGGGTLAADTFSIRGGGCTEAAKNLKFTLTSALGNCTYERATVTGSFVTNVTPVTLKVGASQTFTRTAGSESLCPATGTLDGGWNLYTDNLPTETPLTIS